MISAKHRCLHSDEQGNQVQRGFISQAASRFCPETSGSYTESQVFFFFLNFCPNCSIPKYPKHSANTYLSRCPNQSSSEDAVGTLKNRLQKGLDALGAAAYAVANMQTELEAQNPVGVRLHEAEIVIEPFTCENQFVRYDMLTTALEGSTACRCGCDVLSTQVGS